MYSSYVPPYRPIHVSIAMYKYCTFARIYMSSIHPPRGYVPPQDIREKVSIYVIDTSL